MPKDTSKEKEEEQERELISLTTKQLQGRLEQARRQVRKEYGLTPDEVGEMRNRLSVLEAGKEDWQKTAAGNVKRIRSLQERIEELVGEQTSGKIRTILARQFLESRGLATALPDALTAMFSSGVEFTLDEDDSVKALGVDANEMTGQEFVRDFLRRRAYFTRASTSRGSGMPSGLNYLNLGITSSSLESREGRLAAGRQLAGSNR